MNTAAFPGCSTAPKCVFGGTDMDKAHMGLQHVGSFRKDGETSSMRFSSECLGSGADPVTQTFAQVSSHWIEWISLHG